RSKHSWVDQTFADISSPEWKRNTAPPVPGPPVSRRPALPLGQNPGPTNVTSTIAWAVNAPMLLLPAIEAVPAGLPSPSKSTVEGKMLPENEASKRRLWSRRHAPRLAPRQRPQGTAPPAPRTRRAKISSQSLQSCVWPTDSERSFGRPTLGQLTNGGL